MSKIIFLPSDIYVTHDPPAGAALRFAKYQRSDGKPLYEYYSRGTLEDALDNGDEVWVLLEPRNLAQDFHEWWQALVPKDHLIQVNDLTSTDGYDTLDVLRQFAVKNAPGVSEDALMAATTWMRVLDILCGHGFVRASR